MISQTRNFTHKKDQVEVTDPNITESYKDKSDNPVKDDSKSDGVDTCEYGDE